MNSIQLQLWQSLDFVIPLSNGSSRPKQQRSNGFIPSQNKSQPTEQVQIPKKYKQSGLNGLRGAAKRNVRSACVLLQQIFGKPCLALLTCTVPLVTKRAIELINEQWGQIVRKFLQELTRLLKRRGLPEDYVNVTEIQEDRLKQRKLLVPHLHIVFVGRLPRKTWAIDKTEIRELWNRIISNHTDVDFDGRASTRIEPIKHSVRNYLTKYISKGTAIEKAKEYGLTEQLPRRWYSMTRNLANAVKASIQKLDAGITDFIERNLERFKQYGWLRWYFRIEQEFTDTTTNFTKTVCFGIVGSFSDQGLDKIKALYEREGSKRRLASQLGLSPRELIKAASCPC